MTLVLSPSMLADRKIEPAALGSDRASSLKAIPLN